MSDHTVLMLGGPADGQLIAVSEDVRYLRVVDEFNQCTVEYEIFTLPSGGKDHYVGLTGRETDPIAALIAGYRMPRVKHGQPTAMALMRKSPGEKS